MFLLSQRYKTLYDHQGKHKVLIEEIDLNYWSQKYWINSKQAKTHKAMEVSSMSHLTKQ